MSYIPTLYTPRLRLRPFVLADAKRLQELAGDRRVAATTAHIPHPYPDGAAETWINTHQPAAARGEQFKFAVTLAGTRTPGRMNDVADTGHLIGCVGIGFHGNPDNERAEIGYWMGVPYWNKGFATEAAQAVLDFGFTKRGFHRVLACHVGGNPASGRVMQKLGMTREGVLRKHEQKWGQFVDIVLYGILREEWEAHRFPADPVEIGTVDYCGANGGIVMSEIVGTPEPRHSLQLKELTTERLRLRTFVAEDATALERCLGDARAGLGMGTLVSCTEGNAAEWITAAERDANEGTAFAYAIVLGGTELIGAAGCALDPDHARATLWYWFDARYWTTGICAEVVRAVVTYVFRDLGVNRVETFHRLDNPAAGRALEQLGMKREGLMRQHCRRKDAFADCYLYAVLREEWRG